MKKIKEFINLNGSPPLNINISHITKTIEHWKLNKKPP